MALSATACFGFDNSGTIAVGGFFGGATEDRFFEFVWRVATWSLHATAPVKYTQAGVDVTVMSASGYGIFQGEDVDENGSVTTNAWVDQDDQQEHWRITRRANKEVVNIAGNNFNQITKIQWGPEGSHTPANPGLGDPGGGALSSKLLFGFNGPDSSNVVWLGSERYATVSGGSGSLSLPSSLYLKVKVGATLLNTVLLYQNTVDDAFNYWSCAGDLILEPGSWWPWNLGGLPTWDTTTGAQLRDPKRVVSGANLRRLQHVP